MKKETKQKLVWLVMDLGLAVILVVLDQLSKRAAINKLKDKDAFVILKNVFELDYLENRGSAFGMFQNQKVFLLLVGVVFMTITFYVLWRTPAKKRFLPIHLVAACIIAGGIGNMIDRFFLGYVVDFFSFVLIHFPVFNVADVYIVVSTFMMAFLLIFVYKEDELAFLWKKQER